METELKLFVWTRFSPDYTGGLAFAIAESEYEAREMIIKTRGYNPSDWGSLKIRGLTKFAASVSGGG